jgi:hypothetical protein
VERLVNIFMERVGNVADNEDWAESDGWVGQMVIQYPDRDSVHKYAIKEDSKFHPNDSQGPFVATIRMSVDTFIDLINAATSGEFGPAGPGLDYGDPAVAVGHLHDQELTGARDTGGAFLDVS